MELAYQYLWKHRMFGLSLTLSDGRRAEIIDPGTLNSDAGPDFFNAKIRVDGETWAGDVEIHVRASDWKRHGHDSDRAYDSVILHVVGVDDRDTTRTDGSTIPQAEVVLPKDFYMEYAGLRHEIKEVKCAHRLPGVPPLIIADWKESLFVERLQQKAARIIDTFRLTDRDWHQTLFITLARAFGFGLNGQPFEMLARATPLHYMRRHSDNMAQLEAILFGQAGMLSPTAYMFDTYYQSLCREYSFLSRKYSLRAIDPRVWKMARTRPQNMPHRRIAMLARSITSPSEGLAAAMLDARGREEELRRIFSWELDGYWTRHFGFGRSETPAPGSLGKSAVAVLLINVAAPFYYAYAFLRQDPDIADHAERLLRALPPERNSKVTIWQQAGVKVRDAAESQALIHLRNEYCDRNRCLDCRLGCYMLRSRLAPLPRDLQLSPYAVPEE